MHPHRDPKSFGVCDTKARLVSVGCGLWDLTPSTGVGPHLDLFADLGCTPEAKTLRTWSWELGGTGSFVFEVFGALVTSI